MSVEDTKPKGEKKTLRTNCQKQIRKSQFFFLFRVPPHAGLQWKLVFFFKLVCFFQVLKHLYVRSTGTIKRVVLAYGNKK